VSCPPALRPAVVILLGMLAAKGTSVLRNVDIIARGYEQLQERLVSLGARIETFRDRPNPAPAVHPPAPPVAEVVIFARGSDETVTTSRQTHYLARGWVGLRGAAACGPGWRGPGLPPPGGT